MTSMFDTPPLVVFIPGLGCDAALWAAQISALRDRWEVTVSNALQSEGDLPAKAQYILDTTENRPLVLCGSSMGGMIATEAALLAPHRVQALALIDSTARPDTVAARTMRDMATDAIAQGHFERLMRVNIPFVLHKQAADDPVIARTFMDMLLRTGPEQTISQHRAVGARRDLRGDLGHMACPTLVVCGRQDRITPAEDAQELAALIPHAELHWIENCGHLPSIERPDELNGLLSTWLDKVVQSGTR